MGRKPIKDGEQSATTTIRLTKEQREKLRMLGGGKWVRGKIDEAKNERAMQAMPDTKNRPLRHEMCQVLCASRGICKAIPHPAGGHACGDHPQAVAEPGGCAGGVEDDGCGIT